MNALLNARDNQLNILLQSLYFSKRCVYFYYGLLFVTLLLILVTIIDGFVVADSLLFIALEVIINVLIAVDFMCRLKLAGTRKFFRSNKGNMRWWNVFDAFVVVTCILLFLVALIAKHGAFKNVDESLEEFVMVMWAVWQLFRLLLIAKK
jgi:hypothetical protein